ncbi:MAG: class I SAM-dependent methyltransferase [Deltaproteobacteria bacterium]|nr:MAG: class I SAM-dependent methyltransferase [Deltaproteobacteria bacterium]
MGGKSARRAQRDYVPAAPQLWLYDFLVAVLARESRWRPALVRQIAPTAEDAMADIGCGTGSLMALISRTAPPAVLIGIDPDPAILERARRKTEAAGATVELKVGYARDAAALLDGRGINKIVSSLVFHQVPMAEKRAGLAAMRAALVPNGELHVADYGLQRTALMRQLFRIVQKGDGYENTEPNARGVLPKLMKDVGFRAVEETTVIATPTGSISLYRAERGP